MSELSQPFLEVWLLLFAFRLATQVPNEVYPPCRPVDHPCSCLAPTFAFYRPHLPSQVCPCQPNFVPQYYPIPHSSQELERLKSLVNRMDSSHLALALSEDSILELFETWQPPSLPQDLASLYPQLAWAPWTLAWVARPAAKILYPFRLAVSSTPYPAVSIWASSWPRPHALCSRFDCCQLVHPSDRLPPQR